MPLNIDWQQILLHILNFVILFAGLWLLLYKPVRKFMQDRRAQYEKEEADSRRLREEAEQAHAAYEKKLADVDAEIEAKRAAARKNMADYESLRKRTAEEQAEAILTSAREAAEREHDQTILNARSEIAGLVTEATEKIVLNESTSQAFDQFLDAAEKTQNGGAA